MTKKKQPVWTRLRDELRSLLGDPETTRETLSIWEANSGPLTYSQEQRLQKAVRVAKNAVGGQSDLRSARVVKALRLMAPVAADNPPPEGSWVSVTRSHHGWHDGRVEGVYRNGEVTDTEGITYQIDHPRDVVVRSR